MSQQSVNLFRAEWCIELIVTPTINFMINLGVQK